MARERDPAAALYRRLLRLYPRAFRERLGESMEQTFADARAGRARQAGPRRLGFLLWTFLETAAGIVREQVVLVRRGVGMKTFRSRLRLAALLSFLLVLPFMVLELTFNSAGRQAIPVAKYGLDMAVLFGVLWMLPLLFILGLMPIVQGVRSGASLTASSVRLAIRVACLALIAAAWAAILGDQLPRFLGVPNSD